MTFCPKAMGQTQWNWALVFTALFMRAKDKMQNPEPAQDREPKRKPPAKSYSCQKRPHLLHEDKLGTPALMWTCNSNSHHLGDFKKLSQEHHLKQFLVLPWYLLYALVLGRSKYRFCLKHLTFQAMLQQTPTKNTLKSMSSLVEHHPIHRELEAPRTNAS